MPGRPIVIKVLLGVVALLGLALVASGIVVLRAAGDLTAGRDALIEGRRALLDGRADDAVDAFGRAEIRFVTASDDAGGMLGSFAGVIPAVGNHVDVARAVADAGIHAAGAGQDLAWALSSMPEGLGALAPEAGRLPIERYATLASAARAAREEAALALEAIEGAPTTYLLGPVLESRWDAEADLRDASRALEASSLLLEGLPAFAGSEAPRRYLVVSENPAELRGTGGLWGAYAILTFRDGRASIGPAAPTQSLPDVSTDQIEAPNPDYRRNYDQFGGASSWQNMNMTPDFPSAARAALGNVAAGGGPDLDGVIAADPFALEAMLRVTGPIEVPGLGLSVDAEQVVEFTTNEAYALFSRPSDRKEVLGAVAADVLARFLAMRGKALPRLRAIGEATGGGHLKVFSLDPSMQSGLELAGAAGDLSATEGGDVVAVTVNNGSANKVDYWAVRQVVYEVRLGGPGEAIASLRTRIENHAPSQGFPRYVLGPRMEELGPGDQLPLISVSCHEPCDLIEARRDDEPVSVATGRELGLPWYRDYRPIPAGTDGTLALAWRTEDAWEGTSSDGSYRLTFLGQTTIEPTDLRVTIEAPSGTNIVWTNVPMSVEGGEATWAGTPQPKVVLEVHFRAPLPIRWWRDLTRPLGG